ncbi:hypothetical protein OHC51_04140 [Stenotrophomonas indicatrix]|uniref:hypothetical protein n=1 Tax=Stenotrophomonas indicatrix TaxID=2045451 RepID=UPI002A9C9D27|nr:hypothetical protein [Stenotrophomonas maltophilia]HEL4288889.1 hypothetical protein [Stenotrophomonas maltophilia]
MDTHTCENSAAQLKQLRDAYQSQLDASVIEELNAVIAALEAGCDRQDKKSAETLTYRVLSIIGDVLRIISNITDLMS